MSETSGTKFVVCIANDGCDDLAVWKLYRTLPDKDAAQEGYLRVVDDSGEDYLYSAHHFVVVDLSESVKETLMAVARPRVA